MPCASSPILQADIVGLSLARDEVLRLLENVGVEPVFENCIFDGEDLSSIDFRGVKFSRCSFAGANLKRVRLANTRWLGCKAGSAKFSYADLTDARICRSDLNNTRWSGAKLASAMFVEVKLTGARFNDAHSLGLSFHDSQLVAADLTAMSLRKQTVELLNLSKADLSGCDFRDAVIEVGSLRNAILRNARFDGADLRAVDLGGLKLADLSKDFKGAIISVEQAAALVGEYGVRVV